MPTTSHIATFWDITLRGLVMMRDFGCRADLLVVKGDVAKDPRLLMDPENIKVIIKNGKIVKNELGFKNQEETDSFGPDGKDQTIESKAIASIDRIHATRSIKRD